MRPRRPKKPAALKSPRPRSSLRLTRLGADPHAGVQRGFWRGRRIRRHGRARSRGVWRAAAPPRRPRPRPLAAEIAACHASTARRRGPGFPAQLRLEGGNAPDLPRSPSALFRCERPRTCGGGGLWSSGRSVIAHMHPSGSKRLPAQPGLHRVQRHIVAARPDPVGPAFQVRRRARHRRGRQAVRRGRPPIRPRVRPRRWRWLRGTGRARPSRATTSRSTVAGPSARRRSIAWLRATVISQVSGLARSPGSGRRRFPDLDEHLLPAPLRPWAGPFRDTQADAKEFRGGRTIKREEKGVAFANASGRSISSRWFVVRSCARRVQGFPVD